jgi:hypothetical protein
MSQSSHDPGPRRRHISGADACHSATYPRNSLAEDSGSRVGAEASNVTAVPGCGMGRVSGRNGSLGLTGIALQGESR